MDIKINDPRMNEVDIIIGEIQSVLTAMRMNTRWSSKNRLKLGIESPLLTSLLALRTRLESLPVKDLTRIEPLQYLKPFLDIILSTETTGPITGVALSAVNKFLKLNFLKLDSKCADDAIRAIADSVAHCKFEGTDPETDEVVLLRIQRTLLACLECPLGHLLSDQNITEMVQTCFKMSIQIRLSVLLRKSAEMTLVDMIRYIFANYDPKNDHKAASTVPQPSVTNTAGPTITASTEGITNALEIVHPSDVSEASNVANRFINKQGVAFQVPEDSSPQVVHKPYDGTGLANLMNFLCSIINPKDANNTDSMQFLGLTLVNTIVEVMGSTLQHSPRLLAIVTEDLTRYLLQNLQSDNVSILALNIRVFFNVFFALRSHVKYQLELFFNDMLTLLTNKQVAFEFKEVVLEILVQLCKDTTFLVDLYINFDCNLQCSNLFEKLLEFLYKNSCPVNGNLLPINLSSLDGLLAIIHNISERMRAVSSPIQAPIGVETLQEQKQLKTTLMTGAESFNKEPKEGFEYLQEKKLLPTPLEAESVAEFLRHTTFVHKKMIGEYFGKDKEFNQLVVKHYCKTFDWRGNDLLTAMRQLLESFRIPGESQQIERIVNAFSTEYMEQNQGTDLADFDAVSLLAFSVIMLNVDQHSTKIKDTDRMTLEQYIKYLRGQNGGRDFPQELLMSIFNRIKENEVKIPEEHLAEGILDHAIWSHLVRKYSAQKDYAEYLETGVAAKCYDGMIYSAIWRVAHAALKSVITVATDGELIVKVNDAFTTCAEISSKLQLTSAFDNLIITLCDLSTILTSSSDRFLADFSNDKKAQLLTITLFSSARKYGDNLREGWRNILVCLIRLNALELLPSLTDIEDIFPVKIDPKEKSRGESPVLGRLLTEGYNLLSFSFFGSDSKQEQKEQPENKLKIKVRNDLLECGFKELIVSSKFLKQESLSFLMKALILGCSPRKSSKKFDESTATLCLDLLMFVCLLNDYRIQGLWPMISDHLGTLVNSFTPQSTHLLISRTVINMLYLALKLVKDPEVTEPVLATMLYLTKMHPHADKMMARKIAVGFKKLVKENAATLVPRSTWELVFHLLKYTLTTPATSVQGLKAISFVITNQHVSSENFGACVEFVGALARVEGASQENAVKCCELLAALSAQVNRVKHLEGDITPDDEKDALMFYWIPVLQRLATLSRDKRWEVRNKAITMMQRALLLDHMTAISADGWHILFDQVIFPLVDEVLKAEDASLPKDNIEELRIRASTILCKTLLQYLPKIVQSGDFNTLWLKILRYIEQYMKEKKGVLAEATAESLKNILLVMITSEILRPLAPGQEPQDPSQALWVLTWTTIDRFCPGLDKEIVVKRPQDKLDVAQSTVLAAAAPTEPSTDAQVPSIEPSTDAQVPSIEPSTDAQTPPSTEPSTTVNIPTEADSNSLV